VRLVVSDQWEIPVVMLELVELLVVLVEQEAHLV
jgi:hypothetical protein